MPVSVKSAAPSQFQKPQFAASLPLEPCVSPKPIGDIVHFSARSQGGHRSVGLAALAVSLLALVGCGSSSGGVSRATQSGSSEQVEATTTEVKYDKVIFQDFTDAKPVKGLPTTGADVLVENNGGTDYWQGQVFASNREVRLMWDETANQFYRFVIIVEGEEKDYKSVSKMPIRDGEIIGDWQVDQTNGRLIHLDADKQVDGRTGAVTDIAAQ